jgi:hypothetical protein
VVSVIDVLPNSVTLLKVLRGVVLSDEFNAVAEWIGNVAVWTTFIR